MKLGTGCVCVFSNRVSALRTMKIHRVVTHIKSDIDDVHLIRVASFVRSFVHSLSLLDFLCQNKKKRGKKHFPVADTNEAAAATAAALINGIPFYVLCAPPWMRHFKISFPLWLSSMLKSISKHIAYVRQPKYCRLWTVDRRKCAQNLWILFSRSDQPNKM